MALIFFSDNSLCFVKPKQQKLETYGEMEHNQTCSALSPQPQESICFQMPFYLFIESVNLVHDWDEEKEIIFTKILWHYVEQCSIDSEIS